MSGYLVWENDLRDWTIKIFPQDPSPSSPSSSSTSASLLQEYMEKHPDQCPDEIVPFHCHPLVMNIIHGTSRGDPSFDDWTIFLRYLHQYSIQRSLVFSVEGYYVMMIDPSVRRRKPVLKSAIEIEKLVQELSSIPEFLPLWDKKSTKKDPQGFHSLLRTRERCHTLSSLISSKLPGFVLRFFPW
jgi:hypothetical protein